MVMRSEEKLPVLTPGGDGYYSVHKELADELCSDMNQHGTVPGQSTALVLLHASYTDFVPQFPKAKAVDDVLAWYSPDSDFALAGLEDPVLRDGVIKFFGPKVPEKELRAWLKSSTRRTLTTMHVYYQNFTSVLVGYKLLSTELPISHIAEGMMRPASVLVPQAEIEGILEQMRRYSRYPEEPRMKNHS